jgi:hypothetical protein
LACLLVIVDRRCGTKESGAAMLSQVTVANDLTLVVGDEAVRLTPTEGFRLAERLIRRSTARMVEEEIGLGDTPSGKRASQRSR